MPELLTLFSIGFAAGLALAIPVGPMAIMLVNTTLERGWRHGSTGALAMATVDGLYAVTVFFVGGAIALWLKEWSLWLSLGGAAILLGLGIKTLYSNLRGLIRRTEIASREVVFGSKSKTFATFFAATVANPPTALYFLALAPSVAELAGAHLVLPGLVFSLGVFIGSVIWQQGLALAGVGLRKLASGSLRLWLGAFGGALIIALALSLAVKALV